MSECDWSAAATMMICMVCVVCLGAFCLGVIIGRHRP